MNNNPYAAPNSIVSDVPSQTLYSAKFGKWVRWSLYLQIIFSVIGIASGFLEYQLLRDFQAGVYSSQEDAIIAGKASDARQAMVGIFQMLVTAVSGILILVWIYRANARARQRGALNLRFTPGWSIGWYFIPIANLWKPFQAMNEIWRASTDPENWASKPASLILSWWWFFWIVSGMAGNASFRLSLRAKEIEELLAANIATQIADLVTIPLCIVFLVIVKRIDRMQTHD